MMENSNIFDMDLRDFYNESDTGNVPVEVLYQAFKDRIKAEEDARKALPAFTGQKKSFKAYWPQFHEYEGHPILEGRVSVYGRQTPDDDWKLIETYSDIDCCVLNPSPVILDADGEADIFISYSGSVLVGVKDMYGNVALEYEA